MSGLGLERGVISVTTLQLGTYNTEQNRLCKHKDSHKKHAALNFYDFQTFCEFIFLPSCAFKIM